MNLTMERKSARSPVGGVSPNAFEGGNLRERASRPI